MKLENEEQTTTFYKETLAFLKDHHEVLKKQYGDVSDGKEVWVNDKYHAKDVLEQFDNLIKFITENSKITIEEPAKAEEPAAAGEPAAAEEPKPEGEVMMEGGDEAAGDMMMEAA
jgi:hypothetical protein